MSSFEVGDLVHVKNGVKFNGQPLEKLTAEVVRKANDFLFLKFDNFGNPGFRYIAHRNDCIKARKMRIKR